MFASGARKRVDNGSHSFRQCTTCNGVCSSFDNKAVLLTFVIDSFDVPCDARLGCSLETDQSTWDNSMFGDVSSPHPDKALNRCRAASLESLERGKCLLLASESLRLASQ